MDDVGERLKRNFSAYHFKLRYDMPDFLSGYIRGHNIYLNGHKPPEERTTAASEEISHAKLTVGDITQYNTEEDVKQELAARRLGMEQLVTLEDLIALYEDDGYDAAHPAEALGIPDDYFVECLANFRTRHGEHFTYRGYSFDLSHGLNIKEY